MAEARLQDRVLGSDEVETGLQAALLKAWL